MFQKIGDIELIKLIEKYREARIKTNFIEEYGKKLSFSKMRDFYIDGICNWECYNKLYNWFVG